MPSLRSFDERCGVSHALEFVGERWALLVVRELLLGPLRFSDLLAALEGVSTNVLTRRLSELAAGGVVHHRQLPRPSGARVYELTERGRQLEAVLIALGGWGRGSAQFPKRGRLGPSSLALSLRATFQSARAARDSGIINLRFSAADGFQMRPSARLLEVRRGEAEDAVATLEGAPELISAIIHEGRELEPALKSGRLKFHGDAAVARAFLGWFKADESIV